MKKLLRLLVFALLGVITLLGLAVATFLYVPPVQKTVLRFAAAQAGFELQSTDLTLGLSRFSATDLSLQGPGISFSAPAIDLDYSLTKLILEHTVSVTSLRVSDFQLALLPDLTPPPPTRSATIPPDHSTPRSPSGLFQPLPIGLNVVSATADGNLVLPDSSRIALEADIRGLIAGHTGNASLQATYYPAPSTEGGTVREIGIAGEASIALAAANRIEKVDTFGSLRIETAPAVSARPFAYRWTGSAAPSDGSERYTLMLSDATGEDGALPTAAANSIIDLKVRFSPMIEAIEGSLDFSAPDSILALANARLGLTTERIALQSTFVREKGRELDLAGRFDAAIRPPVSSDLPISSDPIIATGAWDLAVSTSEVVLETLDTTVTMGGERLLVLELSEDIRMNLGDENLQLGEPGEVLARLLIPELQLDQLNPFISGNRVTPFLDGTIALGLEVKARGDSLVIASPTPLTLSGVSVASAEQVLFEDVDLTLGVDAEITRDTVRLNTSDGFLARSGEGIASASASIVYPFVGSTAPTGSFQIMLDLDRLGSQPGIANRLQIGAGDLVLGVEISGIAPLATSGSLLLRNLSAAPDGTQPVLGGEMRFNATGRTDRSGIEGRVSGKLSTVGSESSFESDFKAESSPHYGPVLDIKFGDLRLDLGSLQDFAQSVLRDAPPSATGTAPRDAGAPAAPLLGGLLSRIPSDLGLRRLELSKGTFIFSSVETVRTQLMAENWIAGRPGSLDARIDLEGFPFIRAGEKAAATLRIDQDATDPSALAAVIGLDLPKDLLPAPAEIRLAATRDTEVENYRTEVQFRDQSVPVLTLDATLDPATGGVSGLAKVDASPQSIGPWLADRLSGLDIRSNLGLSFRIHPDLRSLDTEVDVGASLANLATLDPTVGSAIPSISLATKASLSLQNASSFQLHQFSTTLGPDVANPWLTASIPAPISLNLSDLDDPIPALPANRVLLTVTNREIPIDTFRPLLPSGIEITGMVGSGSIGLRRALGGLTVSSITPPGLVGIGLMIDDQPILDGIELRLEPVIEIPGAVGEMIRLAATVSLRDSSGQITETLIRTRFPTTASQGGFLPGEIFVESSSNLAALKRQPSLRDSLWNLESGLLALSGTVDPTDPATIRANLRFSGENLRSMGALARYGLEGTLKLNQGKDQTEIETDLTFTAPDADSDLRLAGTFASGTDAEGVPPSIQINATSRFLDVNTLTGIAELFSGNPDANSATTPAPPDNSSTSASADRSSTGRPAWPDLNATISTEVETLRYNQTRFNDITAKLAISPEAIAIEEAGFTYREGRGTLNAATIFRDNAYQLKLDGDLNGLDVGALLSDLDPRGRANLSGIFSAEFVFESSSPDLATISDALVGRATLTGRNGRIRALEAKPALKTLLTTGSILGIATAGNNKRPGIVALSAAIPLLETIPFNEIRFELERANDLTTTIPTILISGPYLYVSGNGTIGAAPISQIASAPLAMSLAPASRDPLNRHLRVLGLTSGVLNEQAYERWRKDDLQIGGTVGSPQSDQLWDLLGTALANTLQKGDVDQTYNPTPEGQAEPSDTKKKDDPVINSILNVLENL